MSGVSISMEGSNGLIGSLKMRKLPYSKRQSPLGVEFEVGKLNGEDDSHFVAVSYTAVVGCRHSKLC